MKKRIYLGRWYIMFIVIFMILTSLFAYHIGVLTERFVFEGEDTQTILSNYLEALGMAAVLSILFIPIWHRHLTEFFIIDDEGMKIVSIFGKKLSRSIKWDEINRVEFILLKSGDTRHANLNFSLIHYFKRCNSYLVFATKQVYTDYKNNRDNNFCIFSPNKRIYKVISSYFDKHLVSPAHKQKQVDAFFFGQKPPELTWEVVPPTPSS